MDIILTERLIKTSRQRKSEAGMGLRPDMRLHGSPVSGILYSRIRNLE